MEANNTCTEWLCEKCRSPRVYLFGANLKWLRISEDEEAWTIVNHSETEYQCHECDNQGCMIDLIHESYT